MINTVLMKTEVPIWCLLQNVQGGAGGRMETTDGDRCVSKLVGFGATGELRLCHETASSPY